MNYKWEEGHLSKYTHNYSDDKHKKIPSICDELFIHFRDHKEIRRNVISNYKIYVRGDGSYYD